MTVEGSLEHVLFSMGNPLLDIVADVDVEFLKKFGLKENDAIMAEPAHLPLYEDLIKNYKVQYIAGGSAQNSVRAAQWLLPAKSTVYVGCVGKDSYGKTLRDAATNDGLLVEYLEDASVPTGTCAVLVNGKHRSLVANLSAANHYKLEHLQQPKNLALMEKAKVYYFAGFFMTVCPQAIMQVAKHSHEKQKTFCLNLSAPFVCEFFKEPVLNTLPYVDILFGNESEAAAFAKANGFTEEKIPDIALKIANMPKINASRPRLVIITQGSDPAIVVENGKVTEYAVPFVDPKEIIDTNGAGDCFVGGFLSQLVQGKPLSESIKFGHYAASEVIKRSGCTLPKEPKLKA